MKKIKLNESDLLKIVNQVLNEQIIRQFDEDEIDVLYHIFERELKPPFSKGDKDIYGRDTYHNRDNEWIGWLNPDRYFGISDPFWDDIKYKVCLVFGFSYDALDWWDAIKPHLKSWLESQLNIEIRYMEV